MPWLSARAQKKDGVVSNMLRTRQQVLDKIEQIPQDHNLDPACWADIEDIENIEQEYWKEFHAYAQKEAHPSPRPAPAGSPPPPARRRAKPAPDCRRRRRGRKNNQVGGSGHRPERGGSRVNPLPAPAPGGGAQKEGSRGYSTPWKRGQPLPPPLPRDRK